MSGESITITDETEPRSLQISPPVFDGLGRPRRVMLTEASSGVLILSNADAARPPFIQRVASLIRMWLRRQRSIAFASIAHDDPTAVTFEFYLCEGNEFFRPGGYHCEEFGSGFSLARLGSRLPDAPALWKGRWGDEYTERSRTFDWVERVQPFAQHLGGLDITSVLEVGCNVGHNLLAINSLFPHATLYGVEPNARAREIARSMESPANITHGWLPDLAFDERSIDLVFTRGVMMYIPPQSISVALRELTRVTKRYLALIEPYAESPRPVAQSGRNDLAYARDWGAICEQTVPDLTLRTREPFIVPGTTDDTYIWLFEVTNMTSAASEPQR